MGKHGVYVWGSFGVTALVMILEPWIVARQRRTTEQRLARQLRAEAKMEQQP